MQKTSNTFGLDISRIPLINLRSEFNAYYHLLNDKDFTAQFQRPYKPIKSPYLTWFGMPEQFLTLILQKAITGIESYLPGAVMMELGIRGLLNENNLPFIRDPWSLQGRSTVIKFYHGLPSLLDASCSLKNNNSLWDKTNKFYSEIRNPLFHGFQLTERKLGGVRKAYSHLADIYEWIDSWHSPENIMEGADVLSLSRNK